MNTVDWMYQVEAEVFRRLDKEQIRHLIERICVRLTSEQRDLLLARIALIHTTPPADESVHKRFPQRYVCATFGHRRSYHGINKCVGFNCRCKRYVTKSGITGA
jgi:hypothetical protein